ncbi:MAG: hypothetical protein ACJZ1S_02835, partial [Candidatus Neomarinimicrobiota bacterium]
MADNKERHYNILKLNRVFAISSLVFFAVWILVFVYDFQRPWKKYQIEFRKLEIEKIRQDLYTESIALEKNSNYNQLVEELSAAEKKLTVRKNELDEIVQQLEILDAELYKNNQLYQFAKADLDVLKYEYEKSKIGHGGSENAGEEYGDLTINVNKYYLDVQETESKIEIVKIQERKIRKYIDEIKNSLTTLTRESSLLKRRLTKVDPEAMSFANKIGNIVRDLPILDFIDPYYEVKQVVINGLEEDLVYMGMPKVDRCMTCHVGIDKAGFEDAPQPYKTHPKLDFMVGPNSAHPVSEFGC